MLALALTGTFLLVEVAGGLLTGSLALISDAAHMLTDAAAIAIALAAIRVGRLPPDARRTFGYQRFEIFAAAFNAVLLFAVAVYILYEAYRRIASPREIESLGMLLIAAVGLVVNLLSMRLLAKGKDSSLNVKGAYLGVWSDMLGSLGVIGAALLIRWTGWAWIDSLIAAAIGLWVLPRTWFLLKESLNILLEGVPEGIDLGAVAHAMRQMPNVTEIHDLHVWAITSGKTSLTAHAVIDAPQEVQEQTLTQLAHLVLERFGIAHTVIQVERVRCRAEEEGHGGSQAPGSRGPGGD